MAAAVAATATVVILPRGHGRLPTTDPDPRQVTVLALRADPADPAIDPTLAAAAGQLRNVMPGHGFRLLGAENERLDPGRSLRCDLGDGRALRVTLLDPLDDEGKVRLAVRLRADGRDRPVFDVDVRTPPNQLLFLEKALPGTDARLLIGVGAR